MGGTTYDIGEIYVHAGSFTDNIRQPADGASLYFAFSWSEGWDNNNLIATSMTTPTIAQVQAQYPTYTSFVDGGVDPGTNVGEFSSTNLAPALSY